MMQNESFWSKTMQALAIRGFEPELEAAIQTEAKREHLSLNKAALRLMRRGAGLLTTDKPQPIGDALDEFIGVWDENDLREFEAATAVFNEIDEDDWK